MADDKIKTDDFSNTLREQMLARIKAKQDRRVQEIRESGDRWLEKLAQMPRDSARHRR